MNGTAPSNGWLSRKAALVDGTKYCPQAVAQSPSLTPATAPALPATAAESTDTSGSMFTSAKPPMHSSTHGQKKSVVASAVPSGNKGDSSGGNEPPQGGVLVGSSDMGDSHCGVVITLALCGDYVCSAGGDAMIKVWKAGSLEFVRCVLLCLHTAHHQEASCRSGRSQHHLFGHGLAQ